MEKNKLILLSRIGCCLCEGLEEKLKGIPLGQLNPPLELYIKDIDREDIPEIDIARYSLEVPVLLLELQQPLRRVELPRVSPRLSEEGVLKWLQKTISKQTGQE